jgi:hypothetical protein
MEIKKFPVSLCVPRGWDLAYGKGYATLENPSAVAFFFGMGQHPSLVVPECLHRINRGDRSGQGTKESSDSGANNKRHSRSRAFPHFFLRVSVPPW